MSWNIKTCYGIRYNYCLSCHDGYYLSEDEACLECTEGCKSCTGLGNCNEYKDGYYLNSQRNGCIKCHESCGQCDRAGTTCRRCATNYLQNPDETCTKCNENCKSCSGSINTCTSCYDGFFLSGNNCIQCDGKCESWDTSSSFCTSCPNGKFLYNGGCIDSCATLGVRYGISEGKVCEKCNLDHCLEYDEACQCTHCAEGFYIISDPVTLIEICIPCEVHGCVSCDTNGLGCNRCDTGYELINGACVGDETPITPTRPTSSGVGPNPPSTSGQVQPTNETNTGGNRGNSGSNSSSKNKSKTTGLIVGVVIAVIVIVIMLLKRRNENRIQIRTDDVSGEMQQETNNDNFKSPESFNSTDNPIFAANTSENQVIEDPFINDKEECYKKDRFRLILDHLSVLNK